MTTGLENFAAVAVEVGLDSPSPVEPSTSFVLGGATYGKLGTGTLGYSTSWASVTQDVRQFTLTRPMTRQQGPMWSYEAGTATITLDNSSGDYDPDNDGSPYAGQLLPMVPVRVRASYGPSHGLYLGYADGWTPDETDFQGDYATLTLTATDAMKVLSGITLPAITATGAGDDTGARVRDLLDRAGWYTSAEYGQIDTGNSTLQGTTLGSDALSLIRDAVDSEIGQLYISGTGAVVFRARRALITDTRSTSVQAVFGDSPGTVHTDGTELKCARVPRATDDTTIVNDVQATREGGTLQQVTDDASVAKYKFPRSYPRSGLLLQTDTEALYWAHWVAYVGRDAEKRFESITIDPMADPENLWPQVLGREIGDRIQVWARPAAATQPISKDCFITGITHNVDLSQRTWSTTWTLQDATKYGNFMVLGHPTLGKLGSNALVF